MKIFKENSGYSWRKVMTAAATFLFLFVVIGFEFGLPEIPGSYQTIIAMVFGFYFGKEILRNLKIHSKDGKSNNDAVSGRNEGGHQ